MGMVTKPSTGTPFPEAGRIFQREDNFKVAAPKPYPAGFSSTTMQSTSLPATVTTQRIFASPVLALGFAAGEAPVAS